MNMLIPRLRTGAIMTRLAAVLPPRWLRKLAVVGAALALSANPMAASAADNILQDGTFQNEIGTFSNLSPWSDWTSVGITRAAAPDPIGGNYASIPFGGDLFQRFDPLANGQYELSFFAQNASDWDAKLVFSVQQILGTPMATVIPLGFGKEISLPAHSFWSLIQINFTVDDPWFPVNEFYFSNSYNYPEPLIADSINPRGTVINVANVSLKSLAAVPEPSVWVQLILGFGLIGFCVRESRLLKDRTTRFATRS